MLVAQGTIQVKQDESGKTTVYIDPISDYRVTHKEKKYTVFVEDDGEGWLILEADKPLEAESMTDVLVQAAIAKVKVEINIDKKYKITGLRVPAPPVEK